MSKLTCSDPKCTVCDNSVDEFMEDNKELMQALDDAAFVCTPEKSLLEQAGYPPATSEQNAATDYWIGNTEAIYKEGVHVSQHIIDAFLAGVRWADEQERL